MIRITPVLLAAALALPAAASAADADLAGIEALQAAAAECLSGKIAGGTLTLACDGEHVTTVQIAGDAPTITVTCPGAGDGRLRLIDPCAGYLRSLAERDAPAAD